MNEIDSNPQAIEIQEFIVADYESAVDLWQSIEGVTLNESDTLEAITIFLTRNPGLSFVIKTLDRKVIGTILCGENGRAAQIYHLAVERSYRGKGFGKALVTECLKKLLQLGIPRCNIFVYSDNNIGNRFWLKNGWIDPANWKVLQKRL